MATEGERRLRVLNGIVQRKLTAYVGSLMQETAEQYKEDISKNSVFPPGSRTAPRSSEGQFPFLETGQGRDNVLWDVDVDKLEARAGVTDDTTGTGPYPPTHRKPGGLHLFFLKFSSKKPQNRKWIDNTLLENLPAFKREARRAADQTK